MKHLIIILTLCIALPSLSFAASIEQERMQGSIKQEQEAQQKQVEQQVNEYNKAVDEANKQTDNSDKKAVIVNVPEGYFVCPKTGKLCPIKQ
jgi:Na+-translocating ferredoxin:NAD+ oxidoreductase RnfG subunit